MAKTDPREIAAAFQRVYEANREAVFAYARGLLHHADDAEDCTVETFGAAYRAMKKGHIADPPRAWLLTVARHEAFRKLKRNRWWVPLEACAELASADDIGRRFAKVDEARSLLEGLNADEREAIWMHDGLGLTHQEIGEILGAPLGTVLARVFRARKKIQAQIKAECA